MTVRDGAAVVKSSQTSLRSLTGKLDATRIIKCRTFISKKVWWLGLHTPLCKLIGKNATV